MNHDVSTLESYEQELIRWRNRAIFLAKNGKGNKKRNCKPVSTRTSVGKNGLYQMEKSGQFGKLNAEWNDSGILQRSGNGTARSNMEKSSFVDIVEANGERKQQNFCMDFSFLKRFQQFGIDSVSAKNIDKLSETDEDSDKDENDLPKNDAQKTNVNFNIPSMPQHRADSHNQLFVLT